MKKLDLSDFVNVKNGYRRKANLIYVRRNGISLTKNVKEAIGSPDRVNVLANVDDKIIVVVAAEPREGYSFKNGALNCWNGKFADMISEMIGKMEIGECKDYEGTLVEVDGKKAMAFYLGDGENEG